MSVNLKALIGRLNDTSRNALEGAAGLCLSRTNYDVEVEHVLLKLVEAPDTDLLKILRHFEIDASRFARDVTRALDRLKTGNARTPGLSPRLPKWIERAWLLASIEFGAGRVRSGHLVLAALADDDLGRLVREVSKELGAVSAEALQKDFAKIVSGSAEDREAAAAAAAGPAGGPEVASGVPGKTKSLEQYTEDLTAKARAGKIDPILGRDFEIRQVIDILTRRRQNNPILTGEAGVGKTAVVEGFALRIAAGDVPGPLKNVALRTLDLGLLQAGAGIKGEFENRLKSVIDEVKASPQPIILFIDEAHTMIGAGGSAGQNDAANLLKPALARGELRTMAATTWAEYKKYFEKDAALARRFQVVKVEEPTEQVAIVMMRALAKNLEKHHKGIRILDEAVESSVKLSHRYISGRQLPDKCVSVLDTACAKVAIGQAATPGPVEDTHRLIDQLTVEIDALEREAAVGADHAKRIDAAKAQKAEAEARLKVLDEQWKKEIEIVGKIREVREKLEASAGGGTAPEEVEAQRAEMGRLKAELKAAQGDTPMMAPDVNAQAIAEVIAGWTGIPVGKMQADEIETVRHLAPLLGERVIGQDHALQALAQKIQTSRAGLTDPRRPIGVFLLVGPSGVGKTETAITLADALYGGERNMVTINMSEFQESHTVSSLKGSPPGYVGYGEGGVLTEAVRRKPYSVVLLDEVEKAHPDVMELFYQVFDKGQMEDGEGREIDFKNTVILLTTNAETDQIMKLCSDPETAPDPLKLVETIKPGLNKIFKPALLGRMSIIPYYPISEPVMRQIIKLQLGRIARRLKENHDAAFTYDPAVVDEIAGRCKEVESGARNVDAILTRTVLPDMSGEFLSRMAEGKSIQSVHVKVGDGGKFVYDLA